MDGLRDKLSVNLISGGCFLSPLQSFIDSSSVHRFIASARGAMIGSTGLTLSRWRRLHALVDEKKSQVKR